ncbi:MAG: glycoside hydrolase family 3 C-terminal domain-containing protein [Muribaculaceae bacterium]|nr:glycoside hydrolase family 3 C-terminal domain-containing protein [Muribaculaceae bacterium]
MKRLLFGIVAAATFLTPAAQDLRLTPDNIDEIISAMTPQEKALIVIGTGMPGVTGDNAVIGSTTDGRVPGAAGQTYAIPRLGIPAVVLADGPAGLRIDPHRKGDSRDYYCTHFPIATLLACTWDTTLVSRVGRAIGEEVLEYGADVLLAPALNNHRNPLCGRNFEYYSEDPVVSGNIAAAYVNGVQSAGVGTSVKHFAANNQETNRTANDVIMSQRALREIYLRGFEILMRESDPWTVMSSYNKINGTYTSESPQLLTDILRDEWGFDGMVMTDWFGGKDAVAQMIAGNDMLQPGVDRQYNQIMQGLADGSLDEKILDRNVRRVLEMIVRTPAFKGYKYSDNPDLKAHALLTRDAATDGMVLLKNDSNVLPLSPDVKNVALYGNTSYNFIAGGSGSGNVNRAYTVSLLDGLRNAGLSTDPALEKAYRSYIDAYYDSLSQQGNPMDPLSPAALPDEMVVDMSDIQRQAEDFDMAFITIGRLSGEFADRTPADFNLSDRARRIVLDVTEAFHARGKKVVVILNVGGVIETASWKHLPDAILCAWQGGQEGGNSVADILTGKANPAGKLTMTFPVDLRDHASSYNFPGAFAPAGQPDGSSVRNVDFTDYAEDVYVGYRYFDTFDKDVSYPFGYGLSYTVFDYGDPVVETVGDTFVVRIPVRNAGDVSGKEAVQLYVEAPDALRSDKPAKELKAFAKTRFLAPGETEIVTLVVPADDLASFSPESSSWIVTPGDYTFLIGASSRDIRRKASVTASARERKVHDVLAPVKPLDPLTRK